MQTCSKCGIELIDSDAYEYRGALSCAEHFDEVIEMRDFQRGEIIAEESTKTKVFEGLDMSPDSPIGKANREILKPQLEIASKESGRLKEYERPNTRES